MERKRVCCETGILQVCLSVRVFDARALLCQLFQGL